MEEAKASVSESRMDGSGDSSVGEVTEGALAGPVLAAASAAEVAEATEDRAAVCSSQGGDT